MRRVLLAIFLLGAVTTIPPRASCGRRRAPSWAPPGRARGAATTSTARLASG
jgi:hypothetical protein